ncbi:hypothetical protein [Pantoea vagans]|uniref:hypothetical protein n=1 Tax=Pantoea vagans TaxID=470934 RepID=UPI0023B04076|nr:hypothetical protein [Pantoea vagans]MDE8558832.1 hypothetical protein [Pantoea vagans]MDE8578837.1 hypothetical protein [Pantoea vagans]
MSDEIKDKVFEIIKREMPGRLKYIDINEISIHEENFFGKPYYTINIPKNELGKKKYSNPHPFRSLLDAGNDDFFFSRKKYIEKLIKKKIFKIFLIPYLTIFLMISIGSYYNDLFLILMYLLPLLFGYMTFSISYFTMGDYLKKMADFVVIFTGALGATLLIFNFVGMNTLNDNFIISNANAIALEYSKLYKALRILLSEVFIYFYTIKLLISHSELTLSRKEYLKNQFNNVVFALKKPSVKPKKKKCRNFSLKRFFLSPFKFVARLPIIIVRWFL